MSNLLVRLIAAFWRAVLPFAPTGCLQGAMHGRPGVKARFLYPGEKLSLEVQGVCWVTINED